MTKPRLVLRGAFDYDVDAASAESGIVFDSDDPKENLTDQSFREECDINTIVERFGLTGQLPTSVQMPVSGDFTGITDFHSAMNAVLEAQGAFMQFPAEVRKRFGHDPGEMIAFLADEANREEAVKLGLVPKPPEKTRDVVQAVDELAAKIAPAKT